MIKKYVIKLKGEEKFWSQRRDFKNFDIFFPTYIHQDGYGSMIYLLREPLVARFWAVDTYEKAFELSQYVPRNIEIEIVQIEIGYTITG